MKLHEIHLNLNFFQNNLFQGKSCRAPERLPLRYAWSIFFLFPDDSVRLKDCAVKVTINPISHRCPGKTPKMRHKIGAAPVLRLTQPQGESRRWDLVSSQVLPVGLVLQIWSQLTSNVRWIESISAICRRLSTNQWLKRLLVPEATGRLLLSVGLYLVLNEEIFPSVEIEKSREQRTSSHVCRSDKERTVRFARTRITKKKKIQRPVDMADVISTRALPFEFFQNNFRHLIFSIIFLNQILRSGQLIL